MAKIRDNYKQETNQNYTAVLNLIPVIGGIKRMPVGFPAS
jgi:hypothetical protein